MHFIYKKIRDLHLPIVMAVSEIKIRYARTSLGPWWQTINMMVLSLVLSFVFTKVFNAPSEEYVPFLIIGLIFWNFLQGILVESSVCLVHSRNLILNSTNPIWIYPFKLVFRVLIQFLHHALLIPIVVYYFKIDFNLISIVSFLTGMFVSIFIMLQMASILSILGSRFHDLEQVVTNIVQVLFYATPIIWMPSLVLGREFYMEYNPFYHVINIIRIPVIDGDMQIWQSSLVVSIALLGCLILLNYYIYRRFSKMVSYWV
jgi:ABC-type polysaccharide/polyol phosphate export permease